ncbi:MAG TPA: hypothetical protein VJK54_04030 [Chthoniobacterales bacterium]|nr:hypothetical protein [Chthoniobacterales bacterium]
MFIQGDLVQRCCDHIFWNNAQPRMNCHFQGGDVVFCKIDEVLRFFEHIRLTRKRVILVTGEGDIPCDNFRQQFLPANVDYWFSTNVTQPHPKVVALPLGIGGLQDEVTLNANSIVSAQEQCSARDQWLYVNFRAQTNLKVRQPIYDHFQRRAKEESWITFESPQEYLLNSHFLMELLRHQFVLCPPGNGVDTHRIWETLVAGAYPVVLRSAAMEPFSELPLLLVNDFEEVTLDFLKENLNQLKEKKKNLFMMQMGFWEQKIKDAKFRLAGKKTLGWKEWFHESFSYGRSMLKRRCGNYSANRLNS